MRRVGEAGVNVLTQTKIVETMLVYCWSTVYAARPTLNQHWFNILCLLETYASGRATWWLVYVLLADKLPAVSVVSICPRPTGHILCLASPNLLSLLDKNHRGRPLLLILWTPLTAETTHHGPLSTIHMDVGKLILYQADTRSYGPNVRLMWYYRSKPRVCKVVVPRNSRYWDKIGSTLGSSILLWQKALVVS